jgi:hypothetical protein
VARLRIEVDPQDVIRLTDATLEGHWGVLAATTTIVIFVANDDQLPPSLLPLGAIASVPFPVGDSHLRIEVSDGGTLDFSDLGGEFWPNECASIIRCAALESPQEAIRLAKAYDTAVEPRFDWDPTVPGVPAPQPAKAASANAPKPIVPTPAIPPQSSGSASGSLHRTDVGLRPGTLLYGISFLLGAALIYMLMSPVTPVLLEGSPFEGACGTTGEALLRSKPADDSEDLMASVEALRYQACHGPAHDKLPFVIGLALGCVAFAVAGVVARINATDKKRGPPSGVRLCTKCDAEYSEGFKGVACLDCGAPVGPLTVGT